MPKTPRAQKAAGVGSPSPMEPSRLSSATPSSRPLSERAAAFESPSKAVTSLNRGQVPGADPAYEAVLRDIALVVEDLLLNRATYMGPGLSESRIVPFQTIATDPDIQYLSGGDAQVIHHALQVTQNLTLETDERTGALWVGAVLDEWPTNATLVAGVVRSTANEPDAVRELVQNATMQPVIRTWPMRGGSGESPEGATKAKTRAWCIAFSCGAAAIAALTELTERAPELGMRARESGPKARARIEMADAFFKDMQRWQEAEANGGQLPSSREGTPSRGDIAAQRKRAEKNIARMLRLRQSMAEGLYAAGFSFDAAGVPVLPQRVSPEYDDRYYGPNPGEFDDSTGREDSPDNGEPMRTMSRRAVPEGPSRAQLEEMGAAAAAPAEAIAAVTPEHRPAGPPVHPPAATLGGEAAPGILYPNRRTVGDDRLAHGAVGGYGPFGGYGYSPERPEPGVRSASRTPHYTPQRGFGGPAPALPEGGFGPGVFPPPPEHPAGAEAPYAHHPHEGAPPGGPYPQAPPTPIQPLFHHLLPQNFMDHVPKNGQPQRAVSKSKSNAQTQTAVLKTAAKGRRAQSARRLPEHAATNKLRSQSAPRPKQSQTGAESAVVAPLVVPKVRRRGTRGGRGGRHPSDESKEEGDGSTAGAEEPKARRKRRGGRRGRGSNAARTADAACGEDASATERWADQSDSGAGPSPAPPIDAALASSAAPPVDAAPASSAGESKPRSWAEALRTRSGSAKPAAAGPKPADAAEETKAAEPPATAKATASAGTQGDPMTDKKKAKKVSGTRRS